MNVSNKADPCDRWVTARQRLMSKEEYACTCRWATRHRVVQIMLRYMDLPSIIRCFTSAPIWTCFSCDVLRSTTMRPCIRMDASWRNPTLLMENASVLGGPVRFGSVKFGTKGGTTLRLSVSGPTSGCRPNRRPLLHMRACNSNFLVTKHCSVVLRPSAIKIAFMKGITWNLVHKFLESLLVHIFVFLKILKFGGIFWKEIKNVKISKFPKFAKFEKSVIAVL